MIGHFRVHYFDPKGYLNGNPQGHEPKEASMSASTDRKDQRDTPGEVA